MTTPREERDAIIFTEEFLFSLIRPEETPRVPKEIRERARRLLRHYPSKVRVERLYRKYERNEP